MNKKYIKGFSFDDRPSQYFGYKPKNSGFLVGKTLEMIFDHSSNNKIEFLSLDKLIIDESEYSYQLLAVDSDVFLLTVHMLKETPERNLTFALDLENHLVTRIDSIITTIEKGSTPIVEGTNLVHREIDFGYILSENVPCVRHHYSDDLVDTGISYEDSPISTIYYYIHSSRKITYYQKKFPDNGNEIDKDGVGYGQLDMIKIKKDVYLLTFIKHSHGNQPILLWNKNNERVAANFFGISRRQDCPFLVTGGGYAVSLYSI